MRLCRSGVETANHGKSGGICRDITARSGTTPQPFVDKTRQVYCEGLPLDMDTDALRSWFCDFGQVPERIDCPKDRFTGRCRGFCFAQFGSQYHAIQAVRALNGKCMLGCPIALQLNDQGRRNAILTFKEAAFRKSQLAPLACDDTDLCPSLVRQCAANNLEFESGVLVVCPHCGARPAPTAAWCDEHPDEIQDYLIFAHDRTESAPLPSEGESGKWMLFTEDEHVDSDWAIICDATERGELGFSSKVLISSGSEKSVICVYTTGGTEDQDRVLIRLRELGWRLNLKYKTDAATLAGQYTNRGHGKVSSRVAHGETCEWWLQEQERAPRVGDPLTYGTCSQDEFRYFGGAGAALAHDAPAIEA